MEKPTCTTGAVGDMDLEDSVLDTVKFEGEMAPDRLIEHNLLSSPPF